MLSRAEAESTVRDRRGNGWLLCSLIALAGLAGSAMAETGTSLQAKTTYRPVELTSRDLVGIPVINNKGQAAFTELAAGGLGRARFYDGHRLHDLGTLGGPSAQTNALNDLGQVTGFSTLNATEPTFVHAYRWSLATGMVDIGKQVAGSSRGNAINNKGQVAGFAIFTPPVQLGHAFFWSPQTGVTDIGAFGPTSVADDINDAGTVIGTSESPNGGGPSSLLAFRWTRAEGIREIGTLPNEFTTASDINAAGHIVGGTPFMPGALAHAYLWTPRAGLLDLGTGTGQRSGAVKLNNTDVVVGFTTTFPTLAHGFIWTHDAGFFEIGAASPGIVTSANDVNNRGQVVGSYDRHAFVWTRAGGFVDLNTRLVGAPNGLKLVVGDAISDSGIILAQADNGTFYLLMPSCGCGHEPAEPQADTAGQ